MKKIALALSLSLVVSLVFSQTLTMSQVPGAVIHSFKTKFPNAAQPAWEKETASVYEVGFIDGKKHRSALFDTNGQWLETETEINFGAVPAKVQNAFTSEFENYQVQEVFEIEKDNKQISYEIIAFNPTKNYSLIYSAKGELLKKEEGSETE